MRETLSANTLLREAATYFDAKHNGLAQSARAAARRGFASAGNWMRDAMQVIRRNSLPEREPNFSSLGSVKYGLALVAAGGILAAAVWQNSIGLALLAPVAFYAVEAQMVFLFPLAIDGSARPLCESRLWTKRAGGTLRVMSTVLPLATAMLLGGFLGRGFVRSWCLGCLAVLIWYERLRTTSGRGGRHLACRRAGLPSPADRCSKAARRRVSISRTWRRFCPGGKLPPSTSGRMPDATCGLEIGASRPLHVRKETIRMFNQAQPVRVLYASDLHFRGTNSRRMAEQLVAAVRESSPDLILLGGDLADTKRGLSLLSETVRQLNSIAPVWAVPGNHDALVGLTDVQSAIEQSGGHWLAYRSLSFEKPGLARPLVVDGTPKNNPATQPTILCAHDPAIFPEAIRRGYSLVLAGHLHGGQFVFAERAGRLFPGAWFYCWNGLRFAEGGTTMLVSRGVSDTLPLRWNCPRELLLCEIY